MAGRRDSVISAASAGGAAGAGGIGLQNRVFAWAAAALVAERPLLAGDLAGIVVRVGAQTGFAMDDVAVEADTGCFALFQVKAGLGLGKAADSPLAEALEQVVGQYVNGRLPVRDGSDRSVDAARDVLVLCTDSTAPATVRKDLPTALSRAASQPPGSQLGHELTVKQRKALDVVISHVKPMWEAATGNAADNEDLRGLFRALRVITVDASEGAPQHAAAVATLALGLSPADADAAWPVLVQQGQAASAAREWRDRASIGVALSRRGVHPAPPTRYAGDIETLRELSAANLAAFARDAALPVPGGLRIPRKATTVLAADAGDGNVLIVGDAGAGKSSVTQSFAAARAADQPVIALRASDLAGANKAPLDAPLVAVLRGWMGPPAVLVIDGVDALRGPEDRQFLSDVVHGLSGSRWQVVASARTFDALNNHALRTAFGGAPLSADESALDPRLAGVRHLVVGDLTDDEIDAAVTAPLALASLLEKAGPELRALLRNPFNLRLAAVLVETLTASQQDELLAVRGRVGLLEAYWDQRIRADDQTAREALLARLCAHMAAERSLRAIEAEPLVTAVDSAAVGAMLSENVLAIEPGAVPTGRRILAFSHNILFDYATTLYVLLDPVDPSRAIKAIDADPALPLVARPSFDLLADVLWERRAVGAFWPLCLEVSASHHVLASLAFAARVLCLVRDRNDLRELAPPAGTAGTAGGLSASQEFVRRLVGGLRAPAVLPDAAVAAVALAALARRFADHALGSYVDGALAADILLGLQLRLPLQPDGPGAEDRCLSLVALLDACRENPKQMESLAGAAARQLPSAVKMSTAARDAVRRMLDDEPAMREWGGTVLTWLAESVEGLASVDPKLARETARAVLTFEETRDEQVSLGGGPVLSLNETRRQQAEHGAYLLAEAFDAICAADLQTATQIFCDLAEHEAYEFEDGEWPIFAHGASGYLRYGRDMSMTARGEGEKIATGLGAALSASNAGDAVPAVTVLVGRLHNAAAWAALMASPANSVALGRALLDALDSGALLGHPETHAAAAGLLAALADEGGDDPAIASRLQAAVLRAHSLMDANGGYPRQKDALLGCLRPGTITSSKLVGRLGKLGAEGPPKVQPRLQVEASFTPWSIVDSLAAEGVAFPSPVATAVDLLSDELQATRNGRDERPEHKRRLLETFEEVADIVFAECPTVHPRLALLLVDAAATLACDPRVSPGTPVGERVAAVLLNAANSDTGGLLQ
ncbi:ATP-binding protein [Georgenia faecalis]|uniref:ATP-binding protein n=1 Tax=Georgenia faecalis TaxID=2483799 RepID=A0ABV9DAL4_9MICO|nr:ATP-binding protein [Georgenia faecalis]